MNLLRALLCALALAPPASAVSVVVDYTYDTNNFFGSGNPSGATAGLQARAALDAAAAFFSTALTDSLSPITVPPTFQSAFFNGTFNWNWTQTFTHPATGGTVTLTNGSVPADVYRIYAGGGAISGLTLGIGGPGGWGYNTSGNGGGFTTAEINQINAISDTFTSQVSRRGEPVGDFAAWGGSIRFDSDGSTQWHYNHTTPVQAGRIDFYSVALHELAHSLGFGVAQEWTNLLSGATFSGANARAANGGANPPLTGDTGHWAEGTRSTVFGGVASQEAAMDPTITSGTRKLLTNLDMAALDDIGWDVAPPVLLAGDYNTDGLVNAGDYTVWRDSQGGASPIGTYTAWRNNYGAVAAAEAAALAVPETTAPALLVLAAALGRRR